MGRRRDGRGATCRQRLLLTGSAATFIHRVQMRCGQRKSQSLGGNPSPNCAKRYHMLPSPSFSPLHKHTSPILQGQHSPSHLGDRTHLVRLRSSCAVLAPDRCKTYTCLHREAPHYGRHASYFTPAAALKWNKDVKCSNIPEISRAVEEYTIE